jgi:hypothetical protein
MCPYPTPCVSKCNVGGQPTCEFVVSMGRVIRPAAFPRRERVQEWVGSGVRKVLSSLPLASACGERKKGERGVCVCVDARGMQERSVATQSVMGPCGSNGTVGCSVNGRNGRLEARGGEHANAERGKEQSVFRCLAKGRARGNIYATRTLRGRQQSKTKQDKERTEVALILLYCIQQGRGRVWRRVVPKKASRATCVTWGDRYRGGRICGVAQQMWASARRRHRGLRRNERGT